MTKLLIEHYSVIRNWYGSQQIKSSLKQCKIRWEISPKMMNIEIRNTQPTVITGAENYGTTTA